MGETDIKGVILTVWIPNQVGNDGLEVRVVCRTENYKGPLRRRRGPLKICLERANTLFARVELEPRLRRGGLGYWDSRARLR